MAVLPVILALAAAVSWGFSAICVRAGLRYIPTTLGTFVSLIAGVLLAWLAVLAWQRDAIGELGLEAIVLFGLIGVVNFTLGRYLNFLSVSQLGVTRSTPLVASTPLFSMILAVTLTGEDVNLLTLAGTALVLAGIYVTIRPPRLRQAS